MTDWQATTLRGVIGFSAVFAVIVTQGHEPAWSIALAFLAFVVGALATRRR